MRLKDKIGSMVAALAGPPSYTYARKSEQNVIADDRQPDVPDVLFIEPDQFGWRTSANGTLREWTNVFMQFTIRYPDIGDFAEHRLDAIEDMKALAASFIRMAMEDSDFDLLTGDIPGVIVVEAYDASVVGVEINLAKLIYTDPLPC